MSAFELVETYETVNVLRDGAAVIVEMNRPDVLNAWNPQLGQDMASALRSCHADDVRAVMVTGAGRAFSAGADIGAFSEGEKTASGRPNLEVELHARYHPIMREIRRLGKPVLGAVDGPAAGIGMSWRTRNVTRSAARMRRWPPGVRNAMSSPSSTHFLTELGFT